MFRPRREVDFFKRRFLGRYNCLTLIARMDDKPVGFWIGFELKPGMFYHWLGAVVSDMRRHGVGRQLQEAQQSNPLTLLPGNREIDSEIFRLMALRTPFAVCHADIDNFKPFNDEYGYQQGDQVLLHLAGLCRSAAAEGLDFVGHPGGDDFILIMRSQDWQRRIARIVECFSASCARFYSEAHRLAGGFIGRDRSGTERKFSLMTLSVGAVNVDPSRYSGSAELMRVLSAAKQRAKSRPGNTLILNDGETDRTMRLSLLAHPV
jgi:diguanylate cyclase (GGDEF)-like protein